jgi:thymidylate synthase ThyX
MSNLISAKIIADSKNPQGDRITTFVLVFPRIVLAEFNTHRAISKNSASSRAIPFKKMLEKVKNEPFIPIAWQRDHSGMQGDEYLGNPGEIEDYWLQARDEAVRAASNLNFCGLTKQLCNRLLEPFLYHTVICTGTDWENFFALRAHPQAEIHIADLAEKMLVAYNESIPKPLKEGQWHIPFGDKIDTKRIVEIFDNQLLSHRTHEDYIRAIVKIATARCARISYNNFEGKDDYEADLKLHDMLSSSGHWSPFEHCAQVPITPFVMGGNFKGFTQYRKLFHGENKQDPRVIRK